MAREHADLIFLDGAVYALDAARSWAQSVAVGDGRITAVGSTKEIEEHVGSSTRVVDLAGRMLVPGFIDAHVHPISGGLERLRCDLTACFSAVDCLATARRYAEGHADVEWVLGGGWSMPFFPGGTPRAEDLDAAVPDRPAFLYNRDHHGAWVNSRALELAGITAATPDPPDGRIERDANGSPTGTLHEGAMSLVQRFVPDPTADDLYRALLEGQSYLHSFGITGWQDAILGRELAGLDTFPVYLRAVADKTLSAWVEGAQWWERGRGIEQLEGFRERRERAKEGRFRASALKLMQDGVAENFTAGMIEEYLDENGNPTGNRGLSFFAPEDLESFVVAADADDFQVHFHAIGDRAVRECLNAVAAARRAHGMNDLRHHIAHIQVVHPADIVRFRELGVTANVQALWACMESQMRDLTIPFLGPERAGRQYPFGSLWRNGATLAAGSDWPVSSPDPLAAIQTAVTRTAVPEHEGQEVGDEPLIAGEAIDLPVALAAYTIGSAWVNHRDGMVGSIEVGKEADFAVIDRNLFTVPRDEVWRARVDMTVARGQVVFERDR
jgi:predicted amidohydrolase YtcJ